MRKILTSLILGGALLGAAPFISAQNSYGYKSSITAIPTSAIRVEVALSEDLAYRANNLPKNVSRRGASRGINAGFANNGFYGEKDLNRLTARLEKWTSKELEKKGVNVSSDSNLVLKLTLVDVRPNRPTQKQLSKQPGLSFNSFGNGGAEIEGELFAADGSSLGIISYGYFDTFLDEFDRNSAMWTEARRVMQRFSRRVAKDIASQNAGA